MDKESIELRLSVIATKAKQLAMDLKNGKLWPGDLGHGIGEIREQLTRIEQEYRNDHDRN